MEYRSPDGVADATRLCGVSSAPMDPHYTDPWGALE